MNILIDIGLVFLTLIGFISSMVLLYFITIPLQILWANWRCDVAIRKNRNFAYKIDVPGGSLIWGHNRSSGRIDN